MVKETRSYCFASIREITSLYINDCSQAVCRHSPFIEFMFWCTVLQYGCCKKHWGKCRAAEAIAQVPYTWCTYLAQSLQTGKLVLINTDATTAVPLLFVTLTSSSGPHASQKNFKMLEMLRNINSLVVINR